MNNLKKCFIFLFITFLLITIYLIGDTYALFETQNVMTSNFNTAKWNVKLNEILLGSEENTFIIDNFVTNINTNVKGNKIAPGSSGYFEILLDPTNTDVSIIYEISFDFSNLPVGVAIDAVEETNTGVLTRVSDDTYTNVLSLNDILNNKKDNIRVNIVWNNDEDNNENDSLVGSVFNNKIQIPVTIKVLQYLGDI